MMDACRKSSPLYLRRVDTRLNDIYLFYALRIENLIHSMKRKRKIDVFYFVIYNHLQFFPLITRQQNIEKPKDEASGGS